MDQRLITIESDIRDIAKDLRDHKDQDNKVYQGLTTAINNLNITLAEWKGGFKVTVVFVGLIGTVIGTAIGVYIT